MGVILWAEADQTEIPEGRTAFPMVLREKSSMGAISHEDITYSKS
jgi:hypothetical protein